MQEVVVRNVDIKFWTMAWLMVKFSFATIPAIILIMIILAACGMSLGAVGILIRQLI